MRQKKTYKDQNRPFGPFDTKNLPSLLDDIEGHIDDALAFTNRFSDRSSREWKTHRTPSKTRWRKSTFSLSCIFFVFVFSPLSFYKKPRRLSGYVDIFFLHIEQPDGVVCHIRISEGSEVVELSSLLPHSSSSSSSSAMITVNVGHPHLSHRLSICCWTMYMLAHWGVWEPGPASADGEEDNTI